VDERAGHEDGRRAAGHRAPSEVGVLAALRERLVEAAEAFEQLARVDDVRGLEAARQILVPDRVAERAERRLLGGKRPHRPLQDRSAVCARRGQVRLEPARRHLAVVVGERDERRARCAPARIAAGAWTAGGLAAHDAHADVSQHRLCLGPAAVVDHDHLEPPGRERLRAESGELARQPLGPVARRDDDRHVWHGDGDYGAPA